MKQLCPKCSSRNTYKDGLEMACLMCGKRWPINGQAVVIKKKGRESIVEKSPSGKVGICMNCERKKFIAGADGLCNTCHRAVKGMEPGTQDYADALVEVKRRLTAPVCVSLKKKTRTAKKTVKPIKIDKEMMTPKEGALADLYTVVDKLKFLRNFHMAAADKLTKAIEALES